jgi:predicted phosphodiesterase
MSLYAIGDLHLAYKSNREALAELNPHPDDGLVLCGDVGETAEHLRLAFSRATRDFKHVFWVPGNHELYTLPSSEAAGGAKGQAKYEECVDIAREYGVLTPEDPYMLWNGNGGPCIIALTFALYDYSFRPENVSREGALEWAREEGVCATDEVLLFPHPYPTRDAWCEALVTKTEERLAGAASAGLPLVIVNHWPLRQQLVYIPRVPRFSLWCGTKKTEDWHRRFNAKVVVTGHLHVRRTDWVDGVRFEECSLGYPTQWQEARDQGQDINGMLREILPGPVKPAHSQTIFRRYG